MTRYRFLDAMGDVVAQGEFPGHDAALAWAQEDDDAQPAAPDHPEEEIFRVEYLGPQGDWRWAGALHG